jgi:hypothetical protein
MSQQEVDDRLIASQLLLLPAARTATGGTNR